MVKEWNELYEDKRIYLDPNRKESEEKMLAAISRDTPIVIARYCICDLNIRRADFENLLRKSKTKLIGLMNACNTRKFVESCKKEWIEYPYDEHSATLGGMTQEEYEKAINIAEKLKKAIDFGRRKFYEGLLERLEQ